MKKIAYLFLALSAPVIGKAPLVERTVAAISVAPQAGEENRSLVTVQYQDGKTWQGNGYGVDTFGNTAGIADDDLTAAIDFDALPTTPATAELRHALTTANAPANRSRFIIVTNTGKIFDNVAMNKSAKTGTPGPLLWNKFIGTYRPPLTPQEQINQNRGMMGVGKRWDFCIGACEYKDPNFGQPQ